jgi:protoporphyrinogen oxidase
VSRPRVTIVGGGLIGATLAWRLASARADVTLLEPCPTLAESSDALDFDGHVVDRLPRLIRASDSRMIEVSRELGIEDKLGFTAGGTGLFAGGDLHDFNGLADILRLTPLTRAQRLRLAWFVELCRLRPSYAALERVPLQRWLRRHCGAEVTDRLWKPLLDARFDADHDELPATYLWARTRHMGPGRGAGREMLRGHFAGGHRTLVDAMNQRCMQLGADIRVNARVAGLRMDGDRVAGVHLGDEVVEADLTVVTVQSSALEVLLPGRLRGLLAAYPRRWLGVTCVILKLPRSLLPYYTLDICSPSPITSVVESSHVVGTDHTDGLRLAYLLRYCDPDAPDMTEDDGSVYHRYVSMVEDIVPSFSRDEVVAWTVQRTREAEPVHVLGQFPRVAPVWPEDVPGLALASNAQIYPRPLSDESTLTFAEQVAGEASAHLGLWG